MTAEGVLQPLLASAGETIRHGDLVVDMALKKVTKGGKEVPVSTLEFPLLHLLVAHPNQVFTREELMQTVWGKQRNVTLRSVDTYFWRLREKLEADHQNPAHLRTARGLGYMFSTGKEEGAGKVLPIRAKSTSASG